MKNPHTLLARQLREATGPNGELDQNRLLELVDAAYRARDESPARAQSTGKLVLKDEFPTGDGSIEDEQVFRDFAAAVSDRFWECDKNFRFTRRWISDSIDSTVREADFFGKLVWDLYRFRTDAPDGPQLKDLLETRRPFRDIDVEVCGSDNVKRFRRLHAVPYFDDAGEFMGYRGSAKDITEELGLRALSADLFSRLESIMNNSPSAIVLKDLDGRYQMVNRQFAEWRGIARDDAIGALAANLLPADVVERMVRQERAVIETRKVIEAEQDFETADGVRFPVSVIKFPVFDRNGQLTGVGTTVTDITERKKVEAALSESEILFRTAFEQNAVGMAIRGIDPRRSRWLEVNQKLCDMLGYTRAELLELTSVDISLPEEQDTAIAFNERLLRREITSYSREKRYVRKDGKIIWTNIWLSAVPDGSGEPVKVIAAIEDITDRKNSETALRESEQRLRAFMDNSPAAILIKDCEGRYLLANKCWHDWFNPDGTDIAGKVVFDFFPQDHAEAVMRADREILETGKRLETDMLTPCADGTVRNTLLQKFPIFGADGAITAIAGINTDISDYKAMEERLAQAQKMEAVGNLTGGVAHDFNNLLTVIQGNAQLLALKADGLESLTDPIVRASRRGARLTQRLLAFSRRQPLHPRPTNPSTLVDGMTDLLRRALGETIEISVNSAPDVWPALADPGQVENALLNLAINSRDAMPEGGKLTISCGNSVIGLEDTEGNPETVPGDYVVISVADTGTGMTPEVQERAFEPFFTTKEIGQGSGLGLSMVYGFASQSGGFVTLESADGRGTTVRLHLPRAEQLSGERVRPARGQPQLGENETILLIEDEPEVRDLGIRILEGLGYRVIPAADGRSARKALDDGPLPDLILSDVVLPGGMSGPDFVAEARQRHPCLKVVFMSGYPAEALAGNGAPGSGDVLINKPFRLDELASHLRTALDGAD